MRINISSFIIVIAFLFNGCDDNSNVKSNKDTNSSKVNEEIIVHNGFTYKTVTSPYTNNIWLDRNLGAARVCTSSNDTACFGDYYQWGRGFDGHQDSLSATTTKQATSITDTDDKFILDEDDWAYNIDRNGSKREKLLLKTDGSFVCPKGFRIPTPDEFMAEVTESNSTNNIDMFKIFLKLPTAGIRYGDNGKVVIKDAGFLTVTTSTSDKSSDYFVYSSDGVGIGLLGDRSNGLNIRCIKAK